MAEVLVTTQTIPNIMLHPTDAYHGNTSGSAHHQTSSQRVPQPTRGYNTHNANAPYRGTTAAPTAPYAFQSTPNLKHDTRSTAPANHRQSLGPSSMAGTRHAYANSSSSTNSTASASNSNASSSTGQYMLPKEDSLPGGQALPRPESTFLTSSSAPDLSLISFNDAAKPSPDRYRRTAKRVDSSTNIAGSQQQAGTPQRWSQQWPTPQAAAQQHVVSPAPRQQQPQPHSRTESADEVRASSARYKRRSVSALETNAGAAPISMPVTAPAPTWSQVAARGHSTTATPVISANVSRSNVTHQRTGSAGSQASIASSTVSRPVNTRQDSYGSIKSGNSLRPNTAPGPGPRAAPTRGGAEAKRMPTPSPLAHPVQSENTKQALPAGQDAPAASQIRPNTAVSQSPAVQHLHALSERDANKGMKSRLRRAFSFGSAQELRKASAQNSANRLRKDQPGPGAETSAGPSGPTEDGLTPEDAIVAAQQEAAGFGAGIYSGQGVIYGSTDNLSISSTASSASMMLRKMGRGVKKSTKSLRGLFRPKSIIGDPAADNAVSSPGGGVAAAEVSLVTVEAEREKVNVNADPHQHPGGGTGFPKLERNSIDLATAGVSRPSSPRHVQNDSISSRKSIVGTDPERQEVLASVKKSILKRNNTSSPVPAEPIPSEVQSLPGTPDVPSKDEYFLAHKFGTNNSTHSLPERRNISWNPKVSFHEVYTSNEYDRRGDIATCNRLTPMLAQQIKEELNSFKMEMEVHELSKPHTHFF